MNYDKLHRCLTESFIEYQYRLDNPFPSRARVMTDFDSGVDIYNGSIADYSESKQYLVEDRIFRSKVEHLVAGVLEIVRIADK